MRVKIEIPQMWKKVAIDLFYRNNLSPNCKYYVSLYNVNVIRFKIFIFRNSPCL